ncbi:hypothetical protein, partial [Massilia sp.]|uniref:hypothetical protein n=1 Tax=Massilia sp. TaxID=1882437 RepID=UPI00289CCAED
RQASYMKNPTSDLVGFFALGFVNGSPHQTLAERVGGEAAILQEKMHRPVKLFIVHFDSSSVPASTRRWHDDKPLTSR